MARSSYVYLAWNHADELLGAWTAKHELITYGKDAKGLRGSTPAHKDYWVARVLRVPDGKGALDFFYKAVDMTDEILKEIE